jgi:hypothetical protein
MGAEAVVRNQDPVRPVIRPGVALLWIPLGAGAPVPVVRWNGVAFEALAAWRERRPRQALFHAALEVGGTRGGFVVEMTPAWGAGHTGEGAVATGPVGQRALGRSRLFRYEVHCWRDGVIPDRGYAVGGPQRLSDDAAVGDRLIEAVPLFPARVWGRDELGTGDMWNSNSLVAWLLEMSGIPTDGLAPPGEGRAPGWTAGLVVARRGRRG